MITTTSVVDNLERIVVENGTAPCDFYIKEGKGATLLNMGVVGMISVLFVTMSGAPLNGPTIGTVIAICGFGAAGKHIRSVFYIYLGALIGKWLGMWEFTQPSIIIGALFATGLAPIGGAYGPIFGILATMLHIAVVQNTADLHFGLNLYNNGFSCGIIALFVNGLVRLFKIQERGDPLEPICETT